MCRKIENGWLKNKRLLRINSVVKAVKSKNKKMYHIGNS